MGERNSMLSESSWASSITIVLCWSRALWAVSLVIRQSAAWVNSCPIVRLHVKEKKRLVHVERSLPPLLVATELGPHACAQHRSGIAHIAMP
jgi:hypothetical protein